MCIRDSSQIVRWIINLAPFGIMGLVYTNVSGNGLAIFTQYLSLIHIFRQGLRCLPAQRYRGAFHYDPAQHRVRVGDGAQRRAAGV